MELRWELVGVSAALGLALWVFDAALDALLFLKGSFLALLLTDVPPQELFMRTLFVVAFLGFGLFAAWQAGRLEAHQRDLRLLRTAVDKAHDGVYIIDPETGEFVDVNDTACERLGYDRDALLAMNMAEVNPLFDDVAEFREFVRSHGGIDRFETTHQRADGTTFPVEVSAADVDLGDRTGRVAISRDITDRRDRLRQIQVIDRFLRHNLHNDVNVIDGRANRIRTGETDDPPADAEQIQQTCARLLAMTDKEREVTRFLAEAPAPSRFDLVAIVDAAAETLEHRFADATLDLRLPDTQPVHTVPQFERALEELVENAVVHGNAETPTVTIEAEDGGEYVAITVADAGPGIPDVERAVVLEDGEITQLEHGRGLGLWFVRLVVEHSGGTVDVAENDEGGTTVTVRLPAAPDT